MIDGEIGSIECFVSMLEAGDIVEALLWRTEALELAAQKYKEEVEAARISSSIFFLSGMLLSANPLVAVLGGLGAASYGYTLYKDLQHTDKFFPLPLVRKSFGQLLDSLGAAAALGNVPENDPLAGVLNYLNPMLSHEYEILAVCSSPLREYLSHKDLPPDKRYQAYKIILKHAQILGEMLLPTFKEIVVHLGGTAIAKTPLLLASEEKTVEVNPSDFGVSAATELVVAQRAAGLGQSNASLRVNNQAIAEIARTILKCCEINKLPCTFSSGVEGYKFNRILLRNQPTTNVDGVLKLGKSLFSELGRILPGITKPPLLSQIRGGLIAVDIPKPENDWKIAEYSDFVQPARKSFESPVKLLIGVDMDGIVHEVNLSNHSTSSLLVGGIKGSGKSNWAKSVICAIAQQYTPESVKLVLSDVQQVEFEPFRELPHLLTPVANNAEETIEALQVAEIEMKSRQNLFAKAGVSNIDEFNAKSHEKIFRIVIFIEETADIVLEAEFAAKFNKLKQRFNQVGRKWGVYLIDSTQSPRKEVIEPLIRGQFSAFLAFMCSRPEESRIILGNQNEDAVNLLGFGDGIFMTSYGCDRVQAVRIENDQVRAVAKAAVAAYGAANFEHLKLPREEDEFPQDGDNVPQSGYEPQKLPRKFPKTSTSDQTLDINRLEFTLGLPLDSPVPDSIPSPQSPIPDSIPTPVPNPHPNPAEKLAGQALLDFEKIKILRGLGIGKQEILRGKGSVGFGINGHNNSVGHERWMKAIQMHGQDWIKELRATGMRVSGIVELVYGIPRERKNYQIYAALVRKTLSLGDGETREEEHETD